MLFSNIRNLYSNNLLLLPLFHTSIWDDNNYYGQLKDKSTETYISAAKSGICSDQEHCKPCDVFSDYLIYFFYGRPVYKSSDESKYPILFVFSPTKFVNLYKIFPFDTGAFDRKLYQKNDKFFYSGKLLDYQLDNGIEINQIEELPKLITALWESNQNYYYAKVPEKTLLCQNISLSIQEREYLEFIYSGENGSWGKSDSRAITIEVILRNFMSFSNLLKVFVPPSMSDEDKYYLRAVIRKSNKNVKIENIPVKRTISGHDDVESLYNKIMEIGKSWIN